MIQCLFWVILDEVLLFTKIITVGARVIFDISRLVRFFRAALVLGLQGWLGLCLG